MPRKETNMIEMIERVAKAIVAQKGWDWSANECDNNGSCQCLCCYYGGAVPIETVRGAEMDSARAAIKAMREPTDAMVTAGDTTFADYEGWGPPRETWPRMIDAALSDAA